MGLPVAVLAGGLLGRHFGAAWFRILMAMGMILVEVMADQGVFNGLHSKRGYKLDFLKTSPLGMNIFFYGVTGDLARRILTTAACVGIGWAVKALAVESGWAGCLGMALAIYVAEELGIFISRFTRSVSLCVYTAYGCFAVWVGLFILIGILPAPGLWVMDGLLAAAAVAVSMLVVRIGMKRWRRTFSDMQENYSKQY